MSLEKHVGDNDGGGRKEKKKKVPQGLWGPAKQLSGCKQHHGPHVQTFKISAHVMGSAWPLSGRTKHPCSFPSKLCRNGRFVPHPSRVLLSSCRFSSPVLFRDKDRRGNMPPLWWGMAKRPRISGLKWSNWSRLEPPGSLILWNYPHLQWPITGKTL